MKLNRSDLALCRLLPLSRLLALVVLVAPSVGAQEVDIYDSGGVVPPEQAAYDVTYYEVSLRIAPDERRIAGSALTVGRVLDPLRHIVLDLDTLLTVSEVTAVELDDGRRVDAGTEPDGGATSTPLVWERRTGRLWIDPGAELAPGAEFAVRVAYEGAPRVAPRAPWDGGFVWAETEAGDPWIATANQGQGSDLWWPSKDQVSDKPDSMAIRIRVPEPLVVATNGRLRDVEQHDEGTRTYHWFVSTPISAYNVALNIAPYRRLETELTSVAGERFPVMLFVLPEDEERGRALLNEIVEHLEFYEDLLGPYPFRADKYGVAQTPHLGMEHQTIIAYGARFDRGAMTGGRDWGFDALHHHELAHEWWGNLVTNADWKDMWLHEGFGTYMQALYAERLGGEERYHEYMAANRRGIRNRSPVAPRESRTAGEIYFNSGGDIYTKGAWVLHTLRRVIGDDAFFTALRRMAYPDSTRLRAIAGEQTRFATTDDFLRIAEEASGRELGWLFEVYLRQPLLPELVAEREGGADADVVRLSWDVPRGLPFPMPVEAEIDGEVRRIEVPADGAAEVSVPAGADVTLDPHGWILRANQGPVTP
jgi:aminopeptidase N